MTPPRLRFPRKLALAAAFAALAGAAVAEPFTFAALGDMPYGEPTEVYPPFRALIGEINRRGPDLVVHVGDTKGGGAPCTDAILADQLGFLNSFAAAAIYTPGDNEWADCHRRNAGGWDPLERLSHIRRTYFAEPGTSFGMRPVAVRHQGARGYPEHVRLIHEGVAFITAHMIGSGNNRDAPGTAAAGEAAAREAAAVDWLAEGFAAAAEAGAGAVVVAIHANIFKDDFDRRRESWAEGSGYAAFGAALQQAAAAYGGPVLLVFGATHDFRVFRPLPETAPNLTGLEVFGGRDMHAVAVRVDTDGEEVFAVAPVMNPALPRPRCLPEPCLPAPRDTQAR